MTEHQVKIHAHDAQGLDVEISELGGRRDVKVPAGQVAQRRVTGDALGRIKAELEAQRNNVQAAQDRLQGHVEVLTEGYGEPPPGSKKWLQQFDPDDPPRKAEIRECLDKHGVPYDDDAVKDDLIPKVPHQ